MSCRYPYALRFRLAYSADATSVVLGAFISAINSDLRRRARKRKLRGRLQTGSLTVTVSGPRWVKAPAVLALRAAGGVG